MIKFPNTDARDMAGAGGAFQGCRTSTILRKLDMRGEEACFQVIRHTPPAAGQRPLFLLIHPGDLVQSPYGWKDRATVDAVTSFWSYTGAGTLKELRHALRQGHNVAVLHRSSSLELAYPERRLGLARKFWTALSPVHARHTTLWGDDLDLAARWLIEAFDAGSRPAIHLAGAYAEPDHGCITSIGEQFLKAFGSSLRDRLTVSPYAPPGNGPGLAWRPGGNAQMDLPDALRAQFAALEEE